MNRPDAARKRKNSQNKSKLRHNTYGRSLVGLGVVCLFLVGALVTPSPYNGEKGSITLVSVDSAAEYYGPDAPQAIVRGYTVPVVQSVVLPEEDDGASDEITVYASEGQKNYHSPTCRFAYASAMRLSLYEAYYLGYTPGPCCSPPSYTG